MVQVAGKYELVENKNFYDLLLKLGTTEEDAKKANEIKSTLDAEVNGNKVVFTYDADFNKHASDLVLNQEVVEKLSAELELKSTTTQNGNVFTIDSKRLDGTSWGRRVITFSNAGLEMKILSSLDGAPTATRIYKRV